MTRATTHGRNDTRRLVALLLVLLVATVAACATTPPPATPAARAEPVVPRDPPGPMRPVVATRMAERLAAIGLDAKSLPPIESLDAATKRRLMKTFSDSLGVPCVGCHAGGDFAADTRRKRVAKRMYNEIVRVLALEGGEAVFCDSCHQGTMFFLDRRDKKRLADYMSDVLVGRLKRVDDRDHTCDTCHGDPPDFKFLSSWKGEPAPDLGPPTAPTVADVAVPELASLPPPAAPKPPSAPPKASPPRPSPPPVAAPPAASANCGDKNNLCPLQIWMRNNVSPAVAANDAAALARALDRVAAFSPDPSWTWAEMSRTAAAAARNGDIKEARKSCQGCHNAYKAAWRDKYRTRPIR